MIIEALGDARFIIAYGLILLIVLGLGGAWLYVTRERRAERRAFLRQERRRRQERRDEEAGTPTAR